MLMTVNSISNNESNPLYAYVMLSEEGCFHLLKNNVTLFHLLKNLLQARFKRIVF